VDSIDPEHLMAGLEDKLKRLPLLARQIEAARLAGKGKKVKSLTAKLQRMVNDSELVYLALEQICGREHSYTYRANELYEKASDELRRVISRLELVLSALRRN
jgi:hypothetical protein